MMRFTMCRNPFKAVATKRAGDTTAAISKRRHLGWVPAVGAALFWLAVWQVVYWYVDQPILVASPLQVLQTLLHLIQQRAFWQASATSLLRVAIAFVLAVVTGTVLAVATSASPWLRALIAPAMGVARATPVASFIILALLWMQKGAVPVLMAWLVVLPMVWGNVVQGIDQIDQKLMQMAAVYGFGWKKTLLRVCVPSVMPYFIAACTSAMGMAWKAGIAAEVLAMPHRSIGMGLYNSKVYLEIPALFAWTAVVILLSMLIEKAMVALIRRAGQRWNVK